MIHPKEALMIAGVLGLCALGYFTKQIWDNNQELKKELVLYETQIQIVEDNTILLRKQLQKERENKEAAFAALSNLAKDVPDDEFNQKLPESIQKIFDEFHNRVRSPR